MPSDPTVFRRGLRVIWSYVRTHPREFGISVAGAAVFAAATVASAIVLGQVADRVITPSFGFGGPQLSARHGVEQPRESGPGSAATPRTPAIVGGSLAILGVAVVRAAGIVTRRYFAGKTSAKMAATLRARVVDRYRELPLSYHRSRPTGELLAHAHADVEAATDVINPLPYSTAVVLLIAFSTVALVITDLFLAGVGLLVLPALAILNRVFSARIEGPAERVQERIADVSAVAHESIDGALVVKTLGLEAAEVERLAAAAEELRKERVTSGTMRASFEPLFDSIPALGIVVLLAIGSWRISTGAITIGTVVQFVALFQLLVFPMRLIGFVLSDIPRAVVSRARLQTVFDEETTLPPATERVPLPTGPLGVSVRSVRYNYPGGLGGHGRPEADRNPQSGKGAGSQSPRPPDILAELSFEVAPDEAVAIVGATGAGKSTLAHLLVRLDDPRSGSIRLGGVDLRHVDSDDLRGSAAVVFQESFLFATSIEDNITLGAGIPHSEVVRAAQLAQAHGFTSALPEGYSTVVGERGVTLSGGQRQRVAIARALARRPRLLILDDATSAVDPTVEAAILDALRRELATTLIVVAYRISTITLADRVLFLEGGRITASGSHHDLLDHPGYAAMVKAYEIAHPAGPAAAAPVPVRELRGVPVS